jgi:hypothetical protein
MKCVYDELNALVCHAAIIQYYALVYERAQMIFNDIDAKHLLCIEI